MKIIDITKNNKYKKEFIEYCIQYGASHDESYVPDKNYSSSENDPAVIIINDSGNIIGASAIMLHPEYREIKKGRFRIFHSTLNAPDAYKIMLDEILKYCSGVEYLWAFLPDAKKETGDLWLKLGFSIDRYSFLMMRFTNDDVKAEFPEGISLEQVKNENDKNDYCDIINICFDKMAGHRRLTLDIMDSWVKEPGHWNEGLMLLKKNKDSIGTVRLQIDDDEHGRSVFLESLAILPKYQRQGLAAKILRESCRITKELGLTKIFLSVNAENENAADLYLKEGFKKISTYVCYGMYLNI